MSSLAFTKDKNQVATPWHIVEFLYDLLDAREKKVLDPTAGAGAMLQFAGTRYGIEYDLKAYNMLCEQYEDGEFINANLFDSSDWIKNAAPEIALMNPPYNADKTKGLEFVRFTADAMGSGMLAAIVPLNCGISTNKAMKAVRAEVLSHHTLKAVFKLNSELFYPAASPSVICIVLKLGEPHHGKTWFALFDDDGLTKDRTKGRIDTNGLWQKTKEEWIRLYREKPSYEQKNTNGNIPCELKQIEDGDIWNPEAIIRTNPEALKPTNDDFKKTVRDYMDWRINQIGLQQFLRENPHLLPPKKERIKLLYKEMEKISKEIKRLEEEPDG